MGVRFCVDHTILPTDEHLSEQEPNAILDLTSLLVTGRASESLSDYLGSGEHMSERVRLSLMPPRYPVVNIRIIGHPKMGVKRCRCPDEAQRLLRKASRSCVSADSPTLGGSPRLVLIVSWVSPTRWTFHSLQIAGLNIHYTRYMRRMSIPV